ncbi:lysine-specific histone demethylase 1B [Caerostris extrusa]|uniref:Lysine-specific histone demethylase 1B n=1 Tax=Caerostris extrusa TaxID=172846 RepID=A0AAV4P2G7_CAEEX|nr:lysine-specific histone demethylase 1B [Caerostris extrusa]
MTENNSVRRVSSRNKRASIVPVNVGEEKKVRGCEKTGCYAAEPGCCLESCDSCSLDSYTSRWYHMSLGEHFCNNCFDNYYRPGKIGHLTFSEWSNKWAVVARASKPTIKRFVANELLPYWVRCNQKLCGKWRLVRLSTVLDSRFIRNFKCTVDAEADLSCESAQSSDVSLVIDSTFMEQLTEEPHLKNSPAGPYLKRFLLEDVGLCPIDSSTSYFKELEDIQPFAIEQCGESSIWIKPDEMDEEETAFADQVGISAATYLGLRNLLVAIWNLNPTEWLSYSKINEHLICRGLVRIYLVSVAEQILGLLSKKSVINHGIIQNPYVKRHPQNNQVLVIGAGISGLAAASHLQNLGVNVILYEAEADFGGRVKHVSNNSLESFLIYGLLNNPLTTLAHQANTSYQILKKNFVLFKQDGDLISEKVIDTSLQELNNLFQGVIESVMTSKFDDNFYDMITRSCKEMRKMSPFCKDPQVFNHLLTQREIELKTDLRNTSILNWESTISVLGDNAFLPSGIKSLLAKLAKNIDINYSNHVEAIDYSENAVKVTTSNGESTFSKVLVTVPLSVLQNGAICFNPELPEYKKKALDSLGNFYCEKLTLEFQRRFWTKNIKVPFSKFGILSKEGIFEVFLDVTSERAGSTPTLVTFISQKSFHLIEDLGDKQIADKCMALLKSVFHRNLAKLTKWHLTHWRKETPPRSYGSYLKVGSEQSAYDDLAKSVDNKIYFAGKQHLEIYLVL